MPLAGVRVKINPAGLGQIEVGLAKLTRHITEEIADDARKRCPIDTGELRESIHTAYPGKHRGWVLVGTDHWAPTEYGSKPHVIEVRRKRVLANKETGEVFGRKVRHPGTPEQPFMRPAAYTKRRIPSSAVK